MNKRLIALSSLLLIPGLFAFHFAVITHGQVKVDSEFQPYYKGFLQEARSRGFNQLDKINITIQFDTIDQSANKGEKTTLGECRVIIGQNPRIKVYAPTWKTMSSLQREMTIYHELGHCFLLKGHTEMEHEQIVSLMNPMLFNQNQYVNNKTQYLNELFSYKPYHAKDYVVTFFMQSTIRTFKQWINSK